MRADEFSGDGRDMFQRERDSQRQVDEKKIKEGRVKKRGWSPKSLWLLPACECGRGSEDYPEVLWRCLRFRVTPVFHGSS